MFKFSFSDLRLSVVEAVFVAGLLCCGVYYTLPEVLAQSTHDAQHARAEQLKASLESVFKTTPRQFHLSTPSFLSQLEAKPVSQFPQEIMDEWGEHYKVAEALQTKTGAYILELVNWQKELFEKEGIRKDPAVHYYALDVNGASAPNRYCQDQYIVLLEQPKALMQKPFLRFEQGCS